MGAYVVKPGYKMRTAHFFFEHDILRMKWVFIQIIRGNKISDSDMEIGNEKSSATYCINLISCG